MKNLNNANYFQGLSKKKQEKFLTAAYHLDKGISTLESLIIGANYSGNNVQVMNAFEAWNKFQTYERDSISNLNYEFLCKNMVESKFNTKCINEVLSITFTALSDTYLFYMLEKSHPAFHAREDGVFGVIAGMATNQTMEYLEGFFNCANKAAIAAMVDSLKG